MSALPAEINGLHTPLTLPINTKTEKPEATQKPTSPKIVFKEDDYLAEIRQQNYIEPTPSSIRDKNYESAIPEVLYGWRLNLKVLWDVKIVYVFEATILLHYLLGPSANTNWDYLFIPALCGICVLVALSLQSAKQKQQLYYAYLTQHVLIDYHNWRWYFHVDMIMVVLLALVIAYCCYDKTSKVSSLGPVLSQTIGLLSIIYTNVINLEAQLISFSKLAENEATRRKVTEGWSDLEVVTEDVLIAYLNYTKQKLDRLVKLHKAPFWGGKSMVVKPPILVSRADLLKFKESQKDSIRQLSWIHSWSFVTPYAHISQNLVRYYTDDKTNARGLNSNVRKSAVIPYNPETKAGVKSNHIGNVGHVDPTEKV
ncbi:hypothetical protein BKA69DRAFT_775554 [Paraphysoderma sedebokerense]|nr:hypothetical protein BKA69DRAFT_775554 [Paraphysoderma sedebokerense]